MEIYLDHAATTSLSPVALEGMMPFLTNTFGNPSSIHSFGKKSRNAVEKVRETILTSLGGKGNGRVVFTSSGTESDNLAIRGFMLKNKKKHLITSSIEHSAVLQTCLALEKEGYSVTYLPVDQQGSVSLRDIENSITADTGLVSIMFANNEVGTIQPILEIGDLCRRKNVVFHCDGVQAVGHLPVDVKKLHIDMLSFSGHKFNGPKGVGGLYLANNISIQPLIFGGGQEQSLRSGTENVANIVGMSLALEESIEKMEQRQMHISKLGKQLEKGMLEISGCHLSGEPLSRLPQLASFTLDGIRGDGLITLLDLQGISASTGSACSMGKETISHVYEAMGYTNEVTPLRLSLGWENTAEEVEYVIEKVSVLVDKIRNMKKENP